MKKFRFASILPLSLLLLGVGLPSSNAAVYYSQNFDSMTLGTINNQTDSGPLAPSATWTDDDADVVQNSVAVSGQALSLNNNSSGAGAYRTGIFDSSANRPTEVLQFDLRLQKTILDYGANASLQQLVLVRGPNIDTQFVFVYVGTKDGSGVVTANRFELRGDGLDTVGSIDAPTSTDWYRFTLNLNWTSPSLDLLVTKVSDSSVFWDPAAITTFQSNGNVNGFGSTADNDPVSGFYLDNLTVGVVPEPNTTALMGVAFAAGIILFRRLRRRTV